MLSGFYFAGKQEKKFKKPLTRREICGIIITTKEPSGVQTGKVLQFKTPLQTKDVEIKMLVHSQRAVAAENTAERRAYQMDHRGRSQRRCPKPLSILRRVASVNCRDMLVSGECAVQ